MRLLVSLLLVLSCLSLQAQDVISVVPFHHGNVKPGSTIKKALKKNKVSRDTLVTVLNNKILTGLKSLLPETIFVIPDTSFLKMLNDSSESKKMEYTSSLDVMNGVAGFLRTAEMTKNGPVYYTGLNSNPSGVAAAQTELHNQHAKYFLVLNKFQAGINFELHYELYDQNFNRIYGDKFVRVSHTSGKMYFSAMAYYFDQFVKAFNEELVRKIKKADTINY